MESQDNLQKRSLTKEQKEKLISEWLASGMSKKKFSDEHGLKYYTFVSWCEALLPKKKKEAPKFTEVKFPVQKPVFAELQRGDLAIKFYQPFPAEYFQLLMN